MIEKITEGGAYCNTENKRIVYTRGSFTEQDLQEYQKAIDSRYRKYVEFSEAEKYTEDYEAHSERRKKLKDSETHRNIIFTDIFADILEGKSPYEILGIGEGTNIAEAIKAHHRLAMVLHPDKIVQNIRNLITPQSTVPDDPISEILKARDGRSKLEKELDDFKNNMRFKSTLRQTELNQLTEEEKQLYKKERERFNELKEKLEESRNIYNQNIKHVKGEATKKMAIINVALEQIKKGVDVEEYAAISASMWELDSDSRKIIVLNENAQLVRVDDDTYETEYVKLEIYPFDEYDNIISSISSTGEEYNSARGAINVKSLFIFMSVMENKRISKILLSDFAEKYKLGEATLNTLIELLESRSDMTQINDFIFKSSNMTKDKKNGFLYRDIHYDLMEMLYGIPYDTGEFAGIEYKPNSGLYVYTNVYTRNNEDYGSKNLSEVFIKEDDFKIMRALAFGKTLNSDSTYASQPRLV